jgi:protein-S-isoprenylcysteine O-methyltransferase Ste14
MRLPVTPSIDPRENAPLSAGVLLGLFAAVKAATDGYPPWMVLALFIVIVIVLLAVQLFTTSFRGEMPPETDNSSRPGDEVVP